jgi:hypothetical protein
MEIICTNGIEVHFFLNNNSHTLNSFTLNRSNSQLLRLFKHVSKRFGIEIEIETVAQKEGGFKQIWKIIGENSGQITVFLSLVMLLIMLKPSSDKELIDLQKRNLILTEEKLELEIQKLISEIDEIKITEKKENIEINETEIAKSLNKTGILPTLNNETPIIKTKSNYYRCLQDDNKISKIENTALIENHYISNPTSISSDEFQDFIRNKEDLPGEIDESAYIRIISPVLENRKYKWTGEYNDKIISFYLNDDDFKRSIESNEVSFAHGDLITCELEIRKKLNEQGDIDISSYAVSIVYKFESSDTNEIIETLHGKKHKKNKSEIKSQRELDFN